MSGPGPVNLARVIGELISVSLGLVCLSAPNAARADDAARFYAGKTITLLVGSAPGVSGSGLPTTLEQIAGGRPEGNIDRYAHALAAVFGAFVPGAPRVVVRNLPGLDGLAPINYLLDEAPPNGAALAMFNAGVITNSLTGAQPAAKELGSLSWIGSLSPDYRICYLRSEAAPRGWRDLKEGKDVVFGTTGLTSRSFIEAQILRKVFKLKVKPILGYPNRTDVYYAVARGELDGGCSSLEGMPNSWLADGKVRPLVRFLRDRIPEIPSYVPSIFRFVANPTERALVELLTTPDTIGRPLAVNGRAPPERVAALRKAFDLTMKDPQFLARAQSENIFVAPKSGQEVDAIVRKLLEPPSDLRQAAQTLMR